MRITHWFEDLGKNPKKQHRLLFLMAGALTSIHLLLILAGAPRLDAAEALDLLLMCFMCAVLHACITLPKPEFYRLKTGLNPFDFSPASVRRLDVVVLAWVAPFFLARIVGGL